jgi:hypothetical protein
VKGELWHRLGELGSTADAKGGLVDRQTSWLKSCLQRNRTTAYGQLYNFSKIKTVQNFRDMVPCISYDDLSPWIDKMVHGEADVLFSGTPVAFETTSGSSGPAKLIPYSNESFADFRQAILPWLSTVVKTYSLQKGSAYFSISPVCRDRSILPCGISVGVPDGGYMGNDILDIFASISAVPSWVGELKDIQTWQLATLYSLVRHEDLVLVSVWSPSFFTVLMNGIASRAKELLNLFANGGKLADRQLPKDEKALVRLEKFMNTRDSSLIWPDLRLVSCWADGSSRPFFNMLGKRLPQASFQPKGLLCTEGVVTVPNQKGLPVLTVDSGFYEFLDERGTAFLGHELKKGERYQVVMTTSGGLYRYITGDQVVFRGFSEGLPILNFTGRSNSVSDLVGEKLTEEFVSSCLAELPGFSMLVPISAEHPRYVLVIDRGTDVNEKDALKEVKSRLCKNVQFDYALRLGQLKELKVIRVPDLVEKYIDLSTARGGRLGDVKVPTLNNMTSWTKYVESLI